MALFVSLSSYYDTAKPIVSLLYTKHPKTMLIVVIFIIVFSLIRLFTGCPTKRMLNFG